MFRSPAANRGFRFEGFHRHLIGCVSRPQSERAFIILVTRLTRSFRLIDPGLIAFGGTAKEVGERREEPIARIFGEVIEERTVPSPPGWVVEISVTTTVIENRKPAVPVTREDEVEDELSQRKTR